MYLERLQIANYGPIRNLDIRFPFNGARPKPVLLVGENGSGKTLALAHIVNAMLMAKDAVYPESTELDSGRVFKIRSSSYISVGAEYSYSRCDFQSGIFVRELRLKKPKSEYAMPPMGIGSRGFDAWESLYDSDEMDHFENNILKLSQIVKEMVSENCLLYFRSNRAEKPAWLNQDNLRAKPQYTEGTRPKGKTRRRLIAHSPLRYIHDWLYDVVYDRAVFEIDSPSLSMPFPASDDTQPRAVNLSVFLGYRGDATNTYNTALTGLQIIMPELAAKNLRFGIVGRHNRFISLMSDQGTAVPNLFQLSSGEMALLSLFLSILRDFDLRKTRNMTFASVNDVKGLVVVYEVDLHLHSRHQHDILPKLVHMFPQVQFVMTTHSPLFVLGMAKMFGDNGFDIYDLPSGSHIDPERFDEFVDAFRAFKATTEFSNEVREKIENTHRPILFVEGETDRDYLQRAAEFLGKSDFLGKFEVQAVGGNGRLKTIWANQKKLENTSELFKKTVVLLHDPESQDSDADKGKIYKRKMPLSEEHPIAKGVENLFDQAALERSRRQHPEFIDIDSPRTRIVRGKEVQVPESWSVNDDEKRNLRNWLCNHGTREDFRHFGTVFEILEKIVSATEPPPIDGSSEAVPS